MRIQQFFLDAEGIKMGAFSRLSYILLSGRTQPWHWVIVQIELLEGAIVLHHLIFEIVHRDLQRCPLLDREFGSG